ncbi:hypothetical protein NLB33_09085 [Mycolicibacterium smegmatis]|uniref:TPR repeat region-containing protein n=1 Tax=Mycolicibacterium smegmatis TaxID=1772 RepID=UPI0020A43EA0|nr:hypothetical protein [Mycolicibacterium smegmatis]MCP2623018.1 hypothetical protein [Mycolicibacterium smegmatis]
MTLSLADLQQWEPEQIEEVGDALAQRARTSGQTAETLRNLQVFEKWDGEASAAAKEALEKSATKLGVSAQEAFLASMGAKKAALDVRSVKNDLKSILDDAAASPAVQVDLATNTVTPPDTTGWEEDDVAKLADKVANLENRIVAVLAAAEEADGDLARVLTAATGGDPVTPSEQGASDAESMKDGELSPEESARLQENTTLTPEQLDALARGDLVLPASQMDYLNQLARSLDGKSTAEIRKLMDDLGADGDRLQDALQILSNEHVSAAGADPSLKPGDAGYVPTRGSFEALPESLRRDLTKPPLEWTPSPAGTYPHARLELLDVAAIADKGNPALQQGSSFDKAVLKQSEIMLSETAKVPPSMVPFNKGQVDPALQWMLSAAGRDQIALHEVLTGSDGNAPNNSMIENLLTRQWADDGAAASGLFTGLAPVANPTDLTDPTQVAQATRAGQIMHAVDMWAGQNAGTHLMNIPGTDGQSLGQVNPELAKGLATASLPFVDDMLGNKLDNTLGFAPLDNLTKAEMPITRDLFAAIDTNKEAGEILNSKAYLTGIEYQHGFTESVKAGGPIDVADLQSAGTLRGVIETAANIADNDAIAYGNLQEVRAYESRGEWLDLAKKLGGQIPGVREILDGFNKLPGDPLRDIFVGDPPTPNPANPMSTNSSEALQYAVTAELLKNNVGDISAFADRGLVSETGTLKELSNENIYDFRNAFLEYFDGIDPKVKAGIEDFEDGYRDAFPKPPGHTGGS